MRELVYVLTVEALIFGMLCVMLVAQRINVFDWPAGRTWPVFSSCVLLVLAYVQLLLAMCCFFAVGRFGVLMHGVMDACARSAGRLASAAFVSVCYVGVLLWVHSKENPDELPCYLNQLWGTSCAAGGAVLWSYGVYLAVLMPVFALLAGLQVTAAGMCKDEQQLSHRRLLCINCAYVLVQNVYLTWDVNAERGCQTPCGVPPATSSAAKSKTDSNVVLNTELLFLLVALAVSDVCAEIVFCFGRRFLLCVPLFYVIRIAQLVTIAVRGNLPWELRVTHLSLAVVLCLLDITTAQPLINVLEAVASWWTGTRIVPWRRRLDSGGKQTEKPDASVELQIPTTVFPAGNAIKAFEVEPIRRRKFMLTFNATSRWPTTMKTPLSKKGS
jgi:hypothetical protein